MTDNSKRTGAAVEAHYQFLTWLMPTIERFPKSHKFTIGDRIQTVALDVLEALVEATYTKERLQHLRRSISGAHAAANKDRLNEHGPTRLRAGPPAFSEF